MPRFTLDQDVAAFGCEAGDFSRGEDGAFEMPEDPAVDAALAAHGLRRTRLPEPPPAPEAEAEGPATRRRKAIAPAAED